MLEDPQNFQGHNFVTIPTLKDICRATSAYRVLALTAHTCQGHAIWDDTSFLH